MKSIENLESLFGPEELKFIYQGTEALLEKNPTPSGNEELIGEEIHKIHDIVVNKLYNNLKNVISTSDINPQYTGSEKSQKNLIAFINSHNYQGEINKTCDKSLKKSVDVLLNPLLRLIIQSGRYTTTSCCSGRIVFFEKDKNFQNKSNLMFGRSGRILYSSHCHILHSSLDEILESLNSNPQSKFNCYNKEQNEDEEETKDDSNTVLSDDSPEYIENEVILKFEPFLIHVECNNIEDASYLLNLCKYVGLKQSGIISCKKKVILAIRGNNVLETPVLLKKYKNEKNGLFLLENYYLVRKEYLVYLINTCNKKMTTNIYQFLRLYEKLKRVFKIEFHNTNTNTYYNLTHQAVQPDVSDSSSISTPKRQPESRSRYIDILGTSKLVKKDKLSFPLGVEKPIELMTFAEDCKYLLRTRCCMASSEEFVVLFGGQENSKSKTICVCDLKNVEKGFKVFDIDESGPDCIMDSTLISDGRIFITFGGRKNADQFSNDTYILYVYNENQNLMAKWAKCDLKNKDVPKPRFRHSICIDKSKSTNQINDQNKIESTSRFYLSGGSTSCNNIDKSLLGDVWRCSISYIIFNNDVVYPSADWECLYDDTTFSCSSGSLAHRPSHSSLVFIGGFTNVNDLLDPNVGQLEELVEFDISSRRISKTKLVHHDTLVKSQPSIENNDLDYESLLNKNSQSHKCLSGNPKIPANIMSHCLVPLKDDEYFLVGGLGGMQLMDHIWYLNLESKTWHKSITMPAGLRARFGSCLLSFYNGKCRHIELWLIGGGMPIIVTYGSIFDKPLRIVLSCENKCQKDFNDLCKSSNLKDFSNNINNSSNFNSNTNSNNTNSIDIIDNSNNSNNNIFNNNFNQNNQNNLKNLKNGSEYDSKDFKNGSFIYIGMYIIVQNASNLKHFKNICEKLSIFDKSRKIVKYEHKNRYLFHSSNCRNNSKYSECPDCEDRQVCVYCKCCSSCNCSYYSSRSFSSSCSSTSLENSYFLVPVVRAIEHPDLSSLPTFNIYSSLSQNPFSFSGEKTKPPQNPRQRFLLLDINQDFKENIKTVGLCGDSLLITLKKDEKIPEIDWGNVAKQFNVNSIALVGEIDGQKRQRKSRLLYGSGDVSTVENGVKYHFNICTNMFSKGNSSERIRIVKTYFGKSKESILKNEEDKKSELIVDMFCGIGYFSIPILKYTDYQKVCKIVCVDVNDSAIKYLLVNAEVNGIDRNRIETYNLDCSEFGEFFGQEFVGKADRVLLGLLPSSEVGWIPALRAINKRKGGILHIHGLTRNKGVLEFKKIRTDEEWKPDVCFSILYTDEEFEKDRKEKDECEYFSIYTFRMIYELCRDLKFMRDSQWSLEMLTVQNVKHYSPHKYHQVVDLKLTPIF